MEALHILWIAVQVMIGFYLVLSLVLLGMYGIARLFNNPAALAAPGCKFGATWPRICNPREPDYAIIVTAYEQTAQLPATVASLLAMNYDNYLIYIVADACNVSGLYFPSDKVVLLRPEQTLASNTGSHFYAINRFQRAHERLTIVDSDNLVHPEYLSELNVAFEAGYIAVQGVREAKNLNTMYACLDAARDKYYHFYDGQVLNGAGSSATLAGSGMAFTTDLYKSCLGDKDIQGPGFDKVLQYEIVKRGYRIAFVPTAIVWDEKTAKPDQLVNQRARWMQSWFRYFGYGFRLLGRGLTHLDWNAGLFGIVLLRPPLFIFLLLGVLMMLANLFIMPIATAVWAVAFLSFVAGFTIPLSRGDTDPRIIRSLTGIPRFIVLQLRSLMRARKAGKYSVATKHGVVTHTETGQPA